MAGYRRFRGRRQWSRNSYYSEARSHIEQARQFSSEVGGVDKDVKEFFFSLSDRELNALLVEYGKKYGADTQMYAQEAYPHWKSGRRQMSGLVAKRLFDLLPNRMPLPQKYDLVRKLWEHFCPRSREVLYAGTGASAVVLQGKVAAHLEKVVQDYTISADLSQRFDWLSAGDVQVRQQLQNYFQQLKRQHLADALKDRLQIVAAHLADCPEDHTVQTVKLGNHLVEIRCTHLAEGVPDAELVNKLRNQKREAEMRQRNLDQSMGCVLLVILFIALLVALGSCGKR